MNKTQFNSTLKSENQTKNHPKVPKIRFKNFNDTWEQRKLGELGSITTGSTPSTSVTEYYSPDGMLWVTPTDICENVTHNTEKKLSKLGQQVGRVVPQNTILVTCIASIGKNTMLGDTGSFNQQINGLTPNESKYEPYFLLTESALWSAQMKRSAAAGTMQIVNRTEFSELATLVPCMQEQRKIADMFRNLDTLITLQQRKHDQLVNIKKSMLEKMFPKNGELVPEVRFAGFTGPWERRKFNDLVLIERGGSPRPIDAFITDRPDGLNWIKIGDAPAHGKYITKTEEKISPEGLSKTRVVQPGDLILSNSMSFGRPYIMGITGCIHDGWLLIRNTKEVFDLIFLCHLLGSGQMLEQYGTLAAGSTVNNLNKELVGSVIVNYPTIEEQRKIGAYLEQIDTLITLHQRKLEKLKNIKKAMLERMFV